MTQEEILDRMEVCPWGERRREGPYVCARYLYTNVPCGGSCSWIFDYLNIKELETKKNKLRSEKKKKFII